MSRPVLDVALMVFVMLNVACHVHGEAPASHSAAITDGVPWTGHPGVGVIRGNGHFCTATLVGSKTVLTAAHCVTEDSGFTFETEGVTYEVSRVMRHPGFVIDPHAISLDDIALLSLATAPVVEPAAINVVPVTVGLELTLVGYGKTETGAGYLGDKHMATNAIDVLDGKRFRFSGSDGDLGIGGTCLGDSGGPAFASMSGQEVVVGVVSSSSAECGVFTWDSRVDSYQDWLITASGGDLHGVTLPADGSVTMDGAVDHGTPVLLDGGSTNVDASLPWDLAAVDGSYPPDGGGPSSDSLSHELSSGGCSVAGTGRGMLGPLMVLLFLWWSWWVGQELFRRSVG
ncbi:MAG: trypsin-like serine protease [Deltaproteobacteria bacterium]|nr:trypsin-like serine protease [Deltaproteobacteria bacterium]